MNGVVYIGSDDDSLYAYPAAGCNSATCGPLWTGPTGGVVESSPAVAKGVVYVGSFDGKLYAFDAAGCRSATCAPLWTGATGGWIWGGGPVVADGVVYAGSYDDKLYAFNATGCGAPACAPLWTATLIGQVGGSPVVAGGVLYIGSGDPAGKGLPLRLFGCGCGAPTCDPLWTAATGNQVEAAPAVAGGVVYVTSSEGMLDAFPAAGCGAATCKPLWTGGPMGQSSNASPGSGKRRCLRRLVRREAVCVSVRRLRLEHLCASLGLERWASSSKPFSIRRPRWPTAWSTWVRPNRKLYAFPAAGCGAATCPPLWSATTGDVIGASPTVVNGTVYIGSEDGRLHAYDLSGDAGVNALSTAPTLSSLHRHGVRLR